MIMAGLEKFQILFILKKKYSIIITQVLFNYLIVNRLCIIFLKGDPLLWE